MSDGERYDEWRRINRGEVDIVIGARSALFAPLKNLGLIVIDEQHSESYKQDDFNPRYDAINMAIKRVELNKGAKVILGSATPTLDAYARALKNIYHLLNLPKRVNKKPLPEVTLVDMNQEFKRSEGHFSLLLLNKIKEKLSKEEQVILLLNRRGYSSFVTCKNCGYTVKCPHCDITLTYHKSSNNLRCHYCGYATNITNVCPECHEKSLTTLGVGTEKIEEELHTLIPAAKILRMDFDTTSKKGSHAKMIEEFKEHKYDILLEGIKKYSKDIFYPMLNITETEVNKENLEIVLRKMITSFIKTHKLSQSAHEEITAMTHSDKQIAQFFQDHEMYMTQTIANLLIKSGFDEKNILENVHISINLIDDLCHEIVYHKHKELNYDIMIDNVVKIIVNLLK